MKLIQGKKWYRPAEIAEMRLITNSIDSQSVKSNYKFVLNLIATGQLRAKNYSIGSKMKYYLVPLSEIERYNSQFAELDNA